MFYIKTRLGGETEFTTEITDENVFTRCPQCGSEFAVDLAEVFSDGDGDLYGTSIFCDACSRKMRAGRSEEDA